MQKRTKFSIFFIIILLSLIVIAFVCASKWTREFQHFLLTQGATEYAKAKDVVITETKDGIKYWEMYAAVGEYDAENVQATLSDIVGNYYQDGEVIMSFTAPKGVYNSDTKEVALLEAVRVVGKEGEEVLAKKIAWVTTGKIITAEGNVIISKSDEVIALSDKATLSTDFKNIEIIDNAELRIYKKYDKRGK